LAANGLSVVDDIHGMFMRSIAPRILEALADTPVVLLVGARQCGKTTLAKSLMGSERLAFGPRLHALPLSAVWQLGMRGV